MNLFPKMLSCCCSNLLIKLNSLYYFFQPILKIHESGDIIISITGINMMLLSETESAPEPTPNFTALRKNFAIAWPLHFSFFGIIFALLMIFTMTSVLNLTISRYPFFQRYRTFTTVNVLLSYFSFVTSLKLLVDPYDSGEHFDVKKFRKIIYIFHSLRFACLTSSFCLIEISIIEVAKLYPTLVKSKRVIYCVVVLHLLLVLAISCYLVFGTNKTVLLIVCQGSTLIFGITVITVTTFSTFKVLCYSARSKSFLNHANKIGMSYMIPRLKGADNNIFSKNLFERNVSKMEKVKQQAKILKQTLENKNLRRITIISSFTAIFGLLLSIHTLYSMVAVYMFSMDTPDSLKWYISQTIGRLVEVCMVTTMAVTVQTKNRKVRKIFLKAKARLTKGFC